MVVGVGVTSSSGREVRFYADDNDSRNHSYETWERRVSFAKEIGEAGVGHGLESGREEVDKGRCQKDTGSNVLAIEYHGFLASAAHRSSREKRECACWEDISTVSKLPIEQTYPTC